MGRQTKQLLGALDETDDDIVEISKKNDAEPRRTAREVTAIVPLTYTDSDDPESEDEAYTITQPKQNRPETVRRSLESVGSSTVTPVWEKPDVKLNFLEIENFKSYGGKHVIGPFSNFNAIIGPNGSGKSNMMDAISFVLGGTSRSGRGVRYEDLIFEGSSEKVGASVSLMFDGLTLSRKITAKRGTTYYLSGSECSASVYIEKLKSLNILVKARNFLVFQGDVEDIAQRPPLELTTLFEEISGSGEFREEYERLSDELSVNRDDTRRALQSLRSAKCELKALEDQKREWLEYAKLQEEQNTLQQRLSLLKLFVNDINGQSLKQTYDRLVFELQDTSEKLEKLKSQLKALHIDKLNFNDSTNQQALKEQNLTNSIHNLTRERDALFRKKKFLENQQDSNERRVIKLGTDTDNLKVHVSEMVRSLDDAQEALDQLAVAVDEAENSAIKLTPAQARRFAELEAECKRKTSKCTEKLSSLTSLKHQTSALLKEGERKLNESERRGKDLEVKVAEAREEYTLGSTSLKKSEDLISTKKVLYETMKREANNVAGNKESLSKSLNDKENSLAEYSANLKEHEFECNRIKIVNRLRTKFGDSHIKGFLNELCTPIAKKFNKAIAAALAPFHDYLVVQSSSIALECINFLKREGQSRIEFVSLDLSGNRERSDFISNFDNNTGGKAIDAIKCESEYYGIFEWVFGGARIAENLTEAQTLISSKNNNNKIITLDGMVFNRNNSLTIQNDDRKLQLFDLKDKQVLLQQISDLQDKLRRLTLFECKAEKELGELEFLVDKLERNYEIAASRQAILSENKQKLETALTSVRCQIDRDARDAAKAHAEHAAAIAQLDKASRDNAEIGKEVFRSLSDELGVEDVGELFGKLKLAKTRQREERGVLEAKIQRISSDVVAQKEKERELDELRAQLQKSNIEAAEWLSDAGTKLANLESELDSAKAEREKLEELLAADEDRKTELERSIDRKRQEIVTLEDLRNQSVLETSRLDDAIKQNTKKTKAVLNEALVQGVTLPLMRGTVDSLKDFLHSDSITSAVEISYESLGEALRQRLMKSPEKTLQEELEAGISKIAENQILLDRTVPNMSVEAHCAAAKQTCKDTAEHCSEMRLKTQATEQKLRLVTQKRRELFQHCFAYVRSAVQRIYPKLTGGEEEGGGQAFLEVDDSQSLGGDDKPFLCGIQYTVMPPSKRFREISLLSGGERSMAALALLFALQAYCPAPFFILDEVDAALDPNNVRILGDFLENMDVQLIVISLKDKLYRRASSIFGIYRQTDDPQSNVLSLSLENYPKNRDSSLRKKQDPARLSFLASSLSSSHDIELHAGQ